MSVETPAALPDWRQAFEAAIRGLQAETIPALAACYHPAVVFSDPFHTVIGRAAVAQAYGAMFRGLVEPRFEDLCFAQVNAELWAVRWVFVFRFSATSALQRIPGTSWLTLDDQGLILRHEDHWDAASFFAGVPGLGFLIRALKRHVAKSATVTKP